MPVRRLLQRDTDKERNVNNINNLTPPNPELEESESAMHRLSRMLGIPLWLLEPAESEIQAAGAEMAVAKFLTEPWTASLNPQEPAISPNIHVRTTKCPNGRLKIEKTAADDHIFVLVRGSIPEYFIIGWILGKEGKRPEWLDNPDDHGAAYWIPESALNSVQELKSRPYLR
jgi:hypothetical protein